MRPNGTVLISVGRDRLTETTDVKKIVIITCPALTGPLQQFFHRYLQGSHQRNAPFPVSFTSLQLKINYAFIRTDIPHTDMLQLIKAHSGITQNIQNCQPVPGRVYSIASTTIHHVLLFRFCKPLHNQVNPEHLIVTQCLFLCKR